MTAGEAAGASLFLAWYLTPGPHAPWRFTDGGKVLVWRDGTTLAFTEQIESSLTRIATNLRVVPPFAALVLLLDATRRRGELAPTAVELLRGELEATLTDAAAKERALQRLADLQAVLRGLRIVPERFWQRRDAAAVLAEATFEHAGLERDPVLAELVTDGLAGFDRTRLGIRSRQTSEAGERLAEGLQCLTAGLGALDLTTLLRRARTGLEDELVAAEIDLPDSARARRLIEALRDDREHAALARLAHDLMAAVRLPRRLSMRDDLPLGGVSDLGSRGSLDRLLPSELAHDDLTLAVRIALNEALYLRREAPPHVEGGVRAILLDAGIRLWGVARVFATAVAMACAGTAERHTGVRAFRAKGAAVEPVDLGSRDGLLAHLAALEIAAHPGEAISAFLAESGGAAVLRETIVITHRAALDDPTFAPALAALGKVSAHVATVDADGRLVLWACGPRGGTAVREARLRLDDLLVPPKGRRTVALRSDRAEPTICSVQPFPLRLPHRLHAQWRLVEPGRAVALTKDRRVMLWTERDRFARQLVDRLPGAPIGFGVSECAVLLVCVHDDQLVGARVALTTEDAVQWQVLANASERPRHVEFLAGGAVAIYHDHVLPLLLEGAVAAEPLRLPSGMRWTSSRFFRRGFEGFALAFDGFGLRLEPVPLAGGMRGKVTALFDRPGHDGPWAVLHGGEVVSTASAKRCDGRVAGAIEAVSADGGRVLLRNGKIADLDAVTTVMLVNSRRYGGFFALEPSCAWIPGGLPSVANRFTHIAVSDSTLLLLRDDRARRIVFERDALWLARPAPSPAAAGPQQPFAPARKSPTWTLREARFADGSRAILDSRGLLHLESSDRSLPALTLVLVDGPLAAWTGDDLRHGSPRLFDSPPNATATAIREHLEAFVARLR